MILSLGTNYPKSIYLHNLYCLENFSPGMTLLDFRGEIKYKKLTIVLECQHENNKIINISTNNGACPESGRPYCGIEFFFKYNVLKKISPGYPCH